MRQALAGMLWSKQCYYFDVDHWLREREAHPLRESRRRGSRNESWFHMVNDDVVSMPDKWEYPWYAAWDLAFHCIPLAIVDPDFALQPDRPDAVPGVPPPERADPRLRVEFRRREPASARVCHVVPAHAPGRARRGGLPVSGGVLRTTADELHLVGEPQGPRRAATSSRAGFSVWTTSACSTVARRCPPAGTWSRRTGRPGWRCSARTCSSWRSRCSSTIRAYEEFVLKFVEHFFWIAAAVDPVGEHPDEMWDEEDGFFYDVLRLPNGTGAGSRSGRWSVCCPCARPQ